MKTAGIILFSCVMLASCSSRNSNNKSKQAETTPQIETAASQVGTTGFQKMDLSYPGSNISFTVKVEDKTLLILPSGLSVTNEAFKHDITGYTVTNAEIGDLNVDGYPELFVYLDIRRKWQLWQVDWLFSKQWQIGKSGLSARCSRKQGAQPRIYGP